MHTVVFDQWWIIHTVGLTLRKLSTPIILQIKIKRKAFLKVDCWIRKLSLTQMWHFRRIPSHRRHITQINIHLISFIIILLVNYKLFMMLIHQISLKLTLLNTSTRKIGHAIWSFLFSHFNFINSILQSRVLLMYLVNFEHATLKLPLEMLLT